MFKTVGSGMLIFLGILALVIMLTLGGLAWRYVIAGPKGAVGAKEAQQTALNRVQQQAKFEQIAADYDGYLVQIQNAQAALESSSATTHDQRETELIGLRQICVTAAQDFNAESRKYLARVWKSAGLPERLNPLACQGS
jgi:Tfp pilus assembly protein PilV